VQNTSAGADSYMNEVPYELPGSLASDPQVRCVRPVELTRELSTA
jgi:hypothetical protein